MVYNDFSPLSHVRTEVLRRRFVETWFYVHSCNTRNLYKQGLVSPDYGSLDYDHLVAWNQNVADHYKDCGAKFKEVHVVGCLWGEP